LKRPLPPAIVVLGPTASGKSNLAMNLALSMPVEIVSVDSALVYRHMDQGTAKPTLMQRAQVAHHLIDLIEPTESYSAAKFCADALQCMAQITERGRIPLLVGGTMLYFKALQNGLSTLPSADAEIRAALDQRGAREGWASLHRELARVDPETADRLDPNDTQRIQRALEVFQLTGTPMSRLLVDRVPPSLPYRVIACALLPSDRQILHQRIATRFASMLQAGLIAEVEQLRKIFELHENLPSMRCVGYRQVWQYLEGEFDQASLLAKGIAATRQLAKRQLTWLRAMTGLKEFDCLAQDLTLQVDRWLAAQLQ
jgi:tRNA dimethylallyltransferase